MFTLQDTRKFIFGLVFCLLSAGVLAAQTTIFTYQGRLTDSAGTAASYDFEFRLFSVESGGAALATNQRFAVPVSGNVFTVRLDFGANFDGQPRWLEIAVKPAGSANPFTVLNPRQPMDSAPYAIRSLNAATSETSTNSTQLGGVAANQFVQTGDTRLTDARPPTPGSGNYIQNTLLQQQANASFNIAGSGRVGGTLTADTVSATTQFNIGNSRVLGTSGTRNIFVGASAGFANTTGADNSFFGQDAGQANTSGYSNAFFGSDAGDSNTIGFNNSFFGFEAGETNTDGDGNSFFGRSAGLENNGGNNNAFFGRAAGLNNSFGDNNTFIGNNAGDTNFIGNNNTMIGANANLTGGLNFSFATAIGAEALVTTSNTIALGRSNGMDKVRVYGLGAAGATALCRNAFNDISTCSSSLRYKTNIASFNSGLNLVNRLRPITFDWKEGGMHDLGLGAEDVEKIEPLLVTYNKDGEVEGVKYDRLGVVLLNAVKEQQTQMETQQTQIEAQQRQLQQQQTLIDGLQKLVCQNNPQAEVCRKGENK